MKKMTEYGSTPFLFWFSFLCLLHSLPVYSAKSSHRRFPSLLISPEEKISLSARQNQLYTTKYFTQVLDHFNYPKSYETFQHRYLINDTYWGGAKSNSPIFVYTGNEGNIEWFAENTGFLYETAPHFKALIIFIEHRFYGKSLPFGGKKDVAYSNATTLGYLSSTQALADYASLIIDLKKNLTATDSPVVVLGGSHGEMLAAWFRLKYPHVTIGALASSSPILNFNNITSPESFNNIITKDFMVRSPPWNNQPKTGRSDNRGLAVVVLDALSRRQWVREEDLAKDLKLHSKQLRRTLRFFEEEKLVTRDHRKETAKGAKIFSAAVAATANGQHTKEGEEKIKLHTHSYCCLDYAQIYDVVRYRLHCMRKKLKDELEDKSTVQEYVCPNCGKRFLLIGSFCSIYCSRDKFADFL